MAKCSWCGKEYPDEQKVCPIDHTSLAGVGNAGAAQEIDNWRPTLIDLNKIEGAFSFEEGFSRPDWRAITRAIKTEVVDSIDFNRAYREAARQWVMRVRADLGAGYHLKESSEFILLSALGEKASQEVLAFAERTICQIQEHLKEAAWRTGYGGHVILLFEEDDDYYQYVSYFHREGTHPTSGGMLITGGGFAHIAAPFQSYGIRTMLAHELSHNCVAHLPLPLWLNEGLAITFETGVASSQRRVLDHEIKEEHLSFWTEENIQTFWTGHSFRVPGDSNKLSYSLAHIVLTLIFQSRGDVVGFIKNARWRDAGQTAAIDYMGVDLGEVMSTFLGPGAWRPQLKKMAEIREAEKKRKAKIQESSERSATAARLWAD